jgi:four helix bundle protein
VIGFIAQHRNQLRGLPGDLTSHVERASVSCAMNVAEAAGRVSTKDRKSRFAIARGEACEVAAALDIAAVLGALDPVDLARVRSLLVRLAQMLSKLSA